jgi:hydrogenase maturation protease
MKEPQTELRETLVIGFGNEWRSDDGLGPRVAGRLAAMRLPRLRTLAVQQLMPELAEELSTVSLAVFVDASIETIADGVAVNAIEPGGEIGMTHVCEPQALLALAKLLFGHAPPAWLVHVTGEHFGVGEGLSEAAQQHAQRAVEIITTLLNTGRDQVAPKFNVRRVAAQDNRRAFPGEY